MSKPTATFLILDLETTGLDPREDQILECAAVVCGPDLVPVGCEYELVLALTPAGAARLETNDYVRNMHTSNGLLELCRAARDVEQATGQRTATELTYDLDKILDSFEWTEGKPIIAGNTIRFDVSFLAVHCPEVVARLHHRQLDVSASILLTRAAGVDLPKGGAHRAMADVVESMNTARRIAGLISDGAKYQGIGSK